ncbi:malto-oligosyltrehalose synthase [Streptomyces sp. ACA25]|uniref:malto-oligosyltrehalose synthase n=1 Tax=Streptomyces sp. ACA25 TaxID=3022596 RepID=UPI002307BD65|nr:malto-oligosyltrehalose synthase [Streptomyces sp. ACA25]MDB1089174.1 malto-oligosyltrehalose synthase [Streptomyces sp. ACA25]
MTSAPLPPPAAPATVPTATYRLQLTPGSGFAAAEKLVPYLASLGISHLHLSPVLDAAPGSEHGYDVTGHTRIRAEFGGAAGLRALADTARRHGLGLVLDIVPNHMAVPTPAELNGPLWDVLRRGPRSRFARWFDIDWQAGHGRILLPVLAGPLGEELSGITVHDGTVRCRNHRFPVREGTAHLPLPELLDAQHYRLAWWRLARTELNYRRFFTISELIGLRAEDPEVFEETHRTVLRLVADGTVQGLRIDHPDGLADPAGYLLRLHDRVPASWTVVEKILGTGERLPADWRVAGTTGYDALRHIDAVLTDPEGCAALTEAYRAFTGAEPDRGGEWAATVDRAARRILGHELAAELGRLTRTAERVCRAAPDLRLRDHAPWALRAAAVELLVRMPVYRPYVPSGGLPPSPADEAMLTGAAEEARRTLAGPEGETAVRTVRDLALGRLGTGTDHDAFRVRFAQVASALRAKAVEDAAFYRYTPLLSACEVGSDPGRPGCGPDDFHTFCARLQRDWPATGTVLSTHDTKRSADVRATLRALTEHAPGWTRLLPRLTRETARYGSPAPDPHLAWNVWQSALGLGVPDPDRLFGAARKAAREAGLRTSWTEPDTAYEAAVENFVRSGPCGAPAELLSGFAEELRPQVRAQVLAAALLHLTMPGVPDIYRGSEGCYRALVDPDNRLPVPPCTADLTALDDGAAPHDLHTEKLRLTAVALRLRRARPRTFGAAGGYRPLRAEGRTSGHCLAFLRGERAGRDSTGGDEVITAVTRLSGRLTAGGGWEGARLRLPAGTWRDLLTGRTQCGAALLASVFEDGPVALLVRQNQI